ncbi:MAG: hypothetical protein ACLGIZ_18970, partial [Acidimicrobiia bacterium]
MTARLPPATDDGDQALEELARRLLELLGRVTGLESTYLTSIDWDGGIQRILFSRNVGSLDIPEGLEVDWSDTLCRRALEGGPACTSDVMGTYPDSAAARAAETLAGVRGVVEAQALTREKAEALLEPWIGKDALVEDLPTPRLVTLDLDPKAPPTAETLDKALRSAGVDATVDDHSRWI